MILLTVLAVVVALVAGWRAWRRLRFFLHIFQLEGYKLNEYRAWLRPRLAPLVLAPSHAAGAGLVVLVAASGAGWAAVLALLGWLIAFASDAAYAGREKKPLAFTERMKRLTRMTLTLASLPVVAGALFAIAVEPVAGVAAFLFGWLLTDVGAPLWVGLAGMLMKPAEASIQEGYKRQARSKLNRQTDLTIVGITGSYGKTSTKFATAEILRQRFNTLATPSSYNTPMGLCLVINNQLRPDHRVLVLEYGIRYPGDMDDLTDIARPSIAVLSTIGVAHLETMGSIERIAHEKGKLIESLKPGGSAVLNVDDERVAAAASRAPEGTTVWRVSVKGDPAADLVASNISYGPAGATFVVRERDGDEAEFTTRLLGEHNVLNVLLGLGVGRALGLRLRQMVPAVSRIQPVEHRLELKKHGGITMIDDAFNSNPVGARNAVEVLAQFDGGRRVIVTPGMIELGERQQDENRRFGEHIARNLTSDGDLAVLVGRRQTKPIQEGLESAGYPAERIKIVGSLFEARDFLQPILREGDVVLYENDLPDQYEE